MFEVGWGEESQTGSPEAKSRYVEAALAVGFHTDW